MGPSPADDKGHPENWSPNADIREVSGDGLLIALLPPPASLVPLPGALDRRLGSLAPSLRCRNHFLRLSVLGLGILAAAILQPVRLPEIVGAVRPRNALPPVLRVLSCLLPTSIAGLLLRDAVALWEELRLLIVQVVEGEVEELRPGAHSSRSGVAPPLRGNCATGRGLGVWLREAGFPVPDAWLHVVWSKEDPAH